MADLHVLGPIEVVGAAGPVKVGGPKQRRLLAALIVNVNSVVTTDRLIEVVWEGDPPAGAQKSFKVYVARLRTALADGEADGLIVTHPSGYGLELDHERLDATRFEHLIDTARAELDLGEFERAVALLDEAMALWRGPAFGEFAGEEWVQASAVRLEAAQIEAHELRVEAQLAFGRHAELLPEIDELIARFPYRDGLRAHRMTALYRAGRHVEALREYQTYRQQLANEVGVEPGTELARLEQRMVSHDDDLLAPAPATRKLRDYELGERVGADDYAVVYRGRQLSVGRDVTIKVIRPELANQIEFIRRFEAEAQLVAGLEHPHIVPMYDFWREPGGAYLVMRWLDGGSLEQRLAQDGPLGTEATVRMIEQIGGALTIAHRTGIIHHDLRPANVVFDEAGHAYLTNFAIAVRSSSTDDSATDSDIYALGALLHEALTGTPPAEPSDAWSSSPISSARDGVLDALVRRACAADPADRFPDMAALVVAARSAMGSGPEADDPVAARDDYVSEELERVNPYKGLRAFGEGDSDDFFGRDQLTEDLLADLDRARFVAVVGPSRVGQILAGAGRCRSPSPRQRHVRCHHDPRRPPLRGARTGPAPRVAPCRHRPAGPNLRDPQRHRPGRPQRATSERTPPAGDRPVRRAVHHDVSDPARRLPRQPGRARRGRIEPGHRRHHGSGRLLRSAAHAPAPRTAGSATTPSP